eukprot:9547192-Heterocapsa_arctica.AAC.1
MFVEVPTTGAAYMAMWTTEVCRCAFQRWPRGRQAGGQSIGSCRHWVNTSPLCTGEVANKRSV